MDQRGMPPRIATVRQMANILVAQHAGPAILKPIGQYWVQNYIKRHNDLKSQYNYKYNYQWAKCEDPVLIWDWFKCV